MSPKKSGAKKKPEVPKEDSIVVLQRELAGLRATLREIVHRFQLRWEAELSTLMDQVAAAKKDAAASPAEWKEFADATLAMIEGLKLRPKRGRLKDLTRIRRFAESARAKAP
jgi:hypothetical protein